MSKREREEVRIEGDPYEWKQYEYLRAVYCNPVSADPQPRWWLPLLSDRARLALERRERE